LITIGSSDMPWFFFRTTSPPLPPSSLATERSLPAFHSTGRSLPTVNEPHLPRLTLPGPAVMPSRCSLVTDGSKWSSAQVISPLLKSPPRSPATQKRAPSSLVEPIVPWFTRNALLNRQ